MARSKGTHWHIIAVVDGEIKNSARFDDGRVARGLASDYAKVWSDYGSKYYNYDAPKPYIRRYECDGSDCNARQSAILDIAGIALNAPESTSDQTAPVEHTSDQTATTNAPDRTEEGNDDMPVYRYNKWGSYPETIKEYAGEERELCYSRLTRLEKYETPLDTDLIPLPYTSGSDYQGQSIEVSNFRAIWRDFSETVPELYRVSGDYGSYGLLVERSVLSSTSEHHTALVEVIKRLEDVYCIYDDNLECEVELEAQSEAWDAWVKHDYRRGLENAGILEEDSEDRVNDDTLFECLRLVVDSANLEWINESGNSAHIDVDRAVQNTAPEDIDQAIENMAAYRSTSDHTTLVEHNSAVVLATINAPDQTAR